MSVEAISLLKHVYFRSYGYVQTVSSFFVLGAKECAESAILFRQGIASESLYFLAEVRLIWL